MFELYTEEARRVIFFARYEASQFGSSYIETEHLVLGLLRQCKDLGFRLSLNDWDYESIRREVETNTVAAPKTSVSVDLPLSNENKRVLAYAAEEAQRLGSKHIKPEHLLLGVLREKECFGCRLLTKRGGDADRIQARLASSERSGPAVFERHLHAAGPKSAPTITIHDGVWNVDYIRSRVQECRAIAWHWRKIEWKRRDVVVDQATGALSFDLSLAKEKGFEQLNSGWKKDHCQICRWELYESDEAEHGVGYSNGRDWLCCECYERFVESDGFFQSSYGEMT
jgi:hypothetical protein